jgi:hypothetical protein
MQRDEPVASASPVPVRAISAPADPAFSFCCLVTKWEQYEVSRAAFLEGGFGDEDCEYLVIDNSDGNVADAYQGTNAFLQAARGALVVLHHQDVRLLEQGREELQQRLDALGALDPDWALCGNAGAAPGGQTVLHLSHPVNDRHVEGGPFPARVMSLDENFIVVRRDANLAVSHDLHGFHHYGVDLCLIAELLGWHAYVVDFLLRHDSPGTMDDVYVRSRQAIAAKYRTAFRSRWIELVTHQPFYASESRVRAELAHVARAVRQAVHVLRQQRRLPVRTRGWRP